VRYPSLVWPSDDGGAPQPSQPPVKDTAKTPERNAGHSDPPVAKKGASRDGTTPERGV